MEGSQQSGFPQLEKVNDDMLYFAWTDASDADTIGLNKKNLLDYNFWHHC